MTAGKSIRSLATGIRLLLLIPFCLLLLVSHARAEEDDLAYLELFNGTSAETVSADRSPRPASQTAENITVVTSKEIEAIHAHTLADVLYTVTGVQLEQLRTPGSSVNIEIEGALFSHILVLIDNVPINNLADNFPDIGSVPVQLIDRVEIVKGAASSSWGNALGGVINVITKAPVADRPFNGLVSGSIGKRTTSDGRAEVTGTVDRIGYYLTGGNLRSDGLVPNNDIDLYNVYGKLSYNLPVKGSLALTSYFTDNSSGIVTFQRQIQGVTHVMNFNQDDVRQLIATLSAQYPLTESLNLEAGLRMRRFDSSNIRVDRIPSLATSNSIETTDEEVDNGVSFKISWTDELQRVVGGVDYDYVTAHLRMPQTQVNLLDSQDDRVGIYLNDTFTLGRFAVTPSARFDHTKIGGDLFSPSFGITYALTENSVLRGYTGRGYSLTSLNRSDSTEKVWTSQVGAETADIPYVWLKGTLFRNDTWNIKVGPVQKQRQLKQGFEVEVRTVPIFGTSLFSGYTFIDARDGDTDAVLKGVARHMLRLGIKYDDPRYLRATLTGNYVDWNADISRGGKYNDIIWDLYLAKRINYSAIGWVEPFLSVHNLANGDQYLTPYNNPSTWAEVGVKCAF